MPLCWCRSVNPEIGAFWEEALYNLTHPGNTVASYSTSPYLLDKLGQAQELEELDVETNIATVALGQCVATPHASMPHASSGPRAPTAFARLADCLFTWATTALLCSASGRWVVALACVMAAKQLT